MIMFGRLAYERTVM